jgi:hypothetical protein
VQAGHIYTFVLVSTAYTYVLNYCHTPSYVLQRAAHSNASSVHVARPCAEFNVHASVYCCIPMISSHGIATFYHNFYKAKSTISTTIKWRSSSLLVITNCNSTSQQTFTSKNNQQLGNLATAAKHEA